MELVEQIDSLNQWLRDNYGITTDTNQALWQIVFSDDVFERRLTYHTKEGLELLTPQMVELPKYKQWIHQKYVLENLVVVPLVNAHELSTQISYEPIWVFQDHLGNYLPPTRVACKFVIDSVYAAKGKKSMAKYKESEDETNPELRVKKIQNELFGNETRTGDSLAHNEGVRVDYGEVKLGNKPN